MNKRIKQLANEARIEVNQRIGYNDRDRDNAFEEVFAELIVKECAKAADEGLAQVTMKVEWPSYHIKKHFGVEE